MVSIDMEFMHFRELNCSYAGRKTTTKFAAGLALAIVPFLGTYCDSRDKNTIAFVVFFDSSSLSFRFDLMASGESSASETQSLSFVLCDPT